MFKDALKGFDKTRFVNHLRPLLKAAMTVFWEERCKNTPCLQEFNLHMRAALLDGDLANIFLENLFCEVLRRRAAALAYANNLLKQLPKGKMQLARLLDAKALQHRSLDNLQVMARSGTRVTFDKLRDRIAALRRRVAAAAQQRTPT